MDVRQPCPGCAFCWLQLPEIIASPTLAPRAISFAAVSVRHAIPHPNGPGKRPWNVCGEGLWLAVGPADTFATTQSTSPARLQSETSSHPVRLGTAPRCSFTPARCGYRVPLLMEVFFSARNTWSVVPLPAPGNRPTLQKFMVPVSKPTQFLGLDFSVFNRSQPVGLVLPTRLLHIPEN